MSLPDIAGSAYTSLVLEQLTEQRATKKSLEQRGSGIITTSGTLVTLLLAFAALVTSSKAFELPTLARILVGASIALFIAAAFSGIAVNWPRPYAEVNLRDVRQLLTFDTWTKSAAEGSIETAGAQIEILAGARSFNATRARWLQLASTCQIASLVFLALAGGWFWSGSAHRPHRLSASRQQARLSAERW